MKTKHKYIATIVGLNVSKNEGEMRNYNLRNYSYNVGSVLATNATHKDFNKPTDSRMVAMPMAAS